MNVPETIQDVPEKTQSNVDRFKEVYDEILTKCIEIRKEAGFSQEFMADWLNTTRKSIADLESKRHIKVGLLLNYADKLSINIDVKFEIF